MRAHELFIGWRYLRRHQVSNTLRGLALFFVLLAVAVQVAFFVFGFSQVGLVLAIPTVFLAVLFVALCFFSVFTSVSLVGVVLGVAALLVVLSVTSGFQASFRDKVLGVNAHLLVLKYGLDFGEYREVMEKAQKVEKVRAVAPFVFNEMMLARGPALSGVLLKGIDVDLSPKVLDIADRLTGGAKMQDLSGRLPANDGGAPLPQIFIGRELQKKLKAKVGDRVRVVTPKMELDPGRWNATGGGTPAAREFRVAGVFYAGFDEYDRRLAYVAIKEAQAFFPGGDVVTGVEMKLDDIEAAPAVGKKLLEALGGTPYRVIDWEELNRNLFAALQMQKVTLVIFLTLIIVVAAFNIIASLTVMVTDKTREIAILKSMGMRSAGVARIFQVAGLTIGTVGAAAGIAVGMLICKVVEHYGYKLDPKVYLIDKLPVQIRWSEVVLTVQVTIAICFLVTLYPALRAAFLRPIDGLREE